MCQQLTSASDMQASKQNRSSLREHWAQTKWSWKILYKPYHHLGRNILQGKKRKNKRKKNENGMRAIIPQLSIVDSACDLVGCLWSKFRFLKNSQQIWKIIDSLIYDIFTSWIDERFQYLELYDWAFEKTKEINY